MKGFERETFQLGAGLVELRFQLRCGWNQDDIDACGQLFAREAESLTEDSPDAIAFDGGLPNPATDREPEACFVESILDQDDNHDVTPSATSASEGSLEVVPAAHAHAALESESALHDVGILAARREFSPGVACRALPWSREKRFK